MNLKNLIISEFIQRGAGGAPVAGAASELAVTSSPYDRPSVSIIYSSLRWGGKAIGLSKVLPSQHHIER